MTLSLFDRPSRPSWLDDAFGDIVLARDPDGLRYYQRSCYDAILKALEVDRSTLAVLATGLGKTEIFSAVAKHWGSPVLAFAHRNELIDQARKRLEKMTGAWVEVEQAELSASSRAQIVVGSIQSFNQRRLERLGKNRFGLVICDEAHRYLAPSYRRAVEWFSGAKVLGVTATPDRADEKALGQIFDSVAFVMDILEGIDAGYLVPLRGRRITLEDIELDKIGVSDGDLVASQLDEEMLKAVEGVVRETLRLEPDRQGIGFFPGIRSAELAAQKFNALIPNSAQFVWGGTPDLERRRIIEDFRRGRFKYLCNCMVATEGFDCPPASLIIQARMSLSRMFVAQTVGRGTRVLPGVVDHLDGFENSALRREAIARSAKPDCVVLDFVGNSRHALVTLTDVLGGDFEPVEVEEAKRREKDGELSDPREALKDARRELERLAKATTARVKSTVRDFDPFHVFQLDDSDRYVQRFGEKPASDEDLQRLKNLGVPDEDLKDLSNKAARKILAIVRDRQKKGLCTYKQLRQLKKRGINETEIKMDRAKAMLTYIADREGWGGNSRKGPVDPKVLNDILYHRRDSGEEG